MEIVIILIIIGIIGFVIFQNLPATKFTSGSKLLSEKKINEAIIVFQSIVGKHPDAPTQLATCFLEQGIIMNSKNQEDISGFQKIFDLKTKLTGNYNRGTFETVEAKANYEIASSNYSIVRKKNLEQDGIKGFNENLKFIQACIKTGIENEFSTLKNNHFVELGKIYFDLGIRNELKKDFINAISTYSASLEYRSKISKNQIYCDTVTRREICKLQIGEVAEYGKTAFIFEDIDKASFNIKNDFYYRYTLKSLTNNPNVAEGILTKHLPADKVEVKALKQYFLNFKKKSAKNKVVEINKNLELLFENQFPIEKTKNFYETIDKVTPEIIKVFPELKVKLDEIKPSLFNKLLINSMDQLNYEVAIDLITKFPDFWEVPELLKNLGICCFGITNESKINANNYKLIISSWLTAVYSDKVILKSLDSTTWDDEYTFTLTEWKFR
jgi:tetratricopeptide (TPR) repeat protein